MTHPLDSLLRPASIAVLGATERTGSVGRQTMENLLEGEFPGSLYAVNPGRDAVLGVACYPDLSALPEPVEHVIFAVGDARIEDALDDVIAHGARAATIMSSLVLEPDTTPDLQQRVRAKIAASGLLVCGGNGMGFYNFRDGVWACGFDTRSHRSDGRVTFISQSGSGMSGILDVDERIDFNLAVSTGQELSVGMEAYIDFALEQPETRVVGLFMETARDPDAMVQVLRKANAKRIPVVVLKVGRTELAARLALSHSGAIAGRDAAYQALFDRYGVQRVNDMDELATALIMFAQPHPVAEGGLVTIHDSGGERQLLIDLADETSVELTNLSAPSVKRLDELLDPGLPAVNPLDAWGAGGPDADKVMADCFTTLMVDPDTALGAVVHDRAPHGELYSEYIDYMRQAHQASGKPAFLVANRQGTGADALVADATRAGFPVLDGLRSFMTGVRCLFAYRDFQASATAEQPAGPPACVVDEWRARLAGGAVLDEVHASELLAQYGLTTNPVIPAADEQSVLAAGVRLGFPVVLKSARAGLLHKTEHDGVRLDLGNELELRGAYEDVRARLGPEVTVSLMIGEPGIEMFLGMIRDEQFGPLVMLGVGGTQIETIGDVAYALPPFDAQAARRLVDSLRMRPLLDGYRGRAPLAIDAFCEQAAKFSGLAAALGDIVDEIDLNPVMLTVERCIAVDVLVAGRGDGAKQNEERRVG